ncbi:phage holin family protein [Mangrovibacillus cuniculi]|uniref:Phage holin family protein n=2 Tax=Mangrovibacillus cuniculi TaxID=2593652 RepID=A0A7S8CEI6_9BACI|nr:phage holin family protein [Mangrovibacillus cuniculi]QPC48496.1 phage holin family protein [Mangrovibacillus cuniculi]
MWSTFSELQVIHAYLFGGVRFLDFLALLMLIDIISGVIKAAMQRRLRSRNALYGYARKILIFGVIIMANIIDNMLNLNGTVAFATVLFYIANEGLSILENLAQVGVKVPTVIIDKLHVIQEERKDGDKNG